MAKRKTETEPTEQPKRQYIQAPVAVDPGVPCSHCGHRYGHHITNTYPNGNRRRICGACGKPFVATKKND